MKTWLKYVISTVIFFLTFTLIEYIFTQKIDWNITIISTLIYLVIYPISDILINKKINMN